MAYKELRDEEKLGIKEAKSRKFERAQEMLKTNFIDPLTDRTLAFFSLDYVRLDGKLANTNIIQVYMF